MLGCHKARELEELGLVQLRASDSLTDLVALHRELGNSGGSAPGHAGHNMDNICLSVSAVPEHKLFAFLASRFIQHFAMAKRYGAQCLRWSMSLSDLKFNTVELNLAA